MIGDPSSPQASLEGGNWKPASQYTAPIVNSVDAAKMVGAATAANTPQNTPNLPVDWLGMARRAYEASETWMMLNVRSTWAKNFAHYRSEHAHDSPILNEANRHRAAYFYPKTRTLVRAIQAATASAFFTNPDVVSLVATDQDSPEQADAVAFMRELANYRLDNTIPWYMLTLGATADAAVLGTVVSHQSWRYEEVVVHAGTMLDEDSGLEVDVYETKVVKDQPEIRLVPPENIRISPSSSWIDPANSSPYLIELIPMFLCDVLQRISQGENSKTNEPGWKNIPRSQLISAGTRSNLDTTAKARAGQNRLDPKSNQNTTETVDEFKIVWIHRNIVRQNGRDWLYYTVGTTIMLSDPVPLDQVIPWAHGKRDYVMGQLEVETDRTHPSGPVELISGLQKAHNELKNQRYDNVRQVLNRRYLYRAGSQVDVRALARNNPGGLIGISAPGALESHVVPLTVQDVTASSYQEEDRLSLLMDDLSGSTTGSTVNSNRRVNETVGGMQLMQEAGNQVREMELHTFIKTWMEPVLTQVVQLLAMYETDETVIMLAARKAGIQRVLMEYFDKHFAVKVNVGVGAVSPTQRMQKITAAVSTMAQLVPDAPQAIKVREVANEVFGAAGFDSGSRFIDFDKLEQARTQPPSDPQIELAEKQMQAKMEIEQGKLQIQQGKLQLESEKHQSAIRELEAKLNLLAAQTATTNVTAVYEATQAAGVIAANPGSAPVTDEILASSGFKDHNSAPITEEVQAPAEQPTENTHPNMPPKPQTGAAGLRRGIETPRIES